MTVTAAVMKILELLLSSIEATLAKDPRQLAVRV
jgi:hypothetical protein